MDGAGASHPSGLTRRMLLGGLGATAVAWRWPGPSRAVGSVPDGELTTLPIADLYALAGDAGDPDGATDALVEVFARSGIAVFDDDVVAPLAAVTGSVSPLAFTRAQLAPMVTELASRSSRPAAAFDALLPVEDHDGQVVPPLSDLYAGYAAAGETSGAEFTRHVLRTIPDGNGDIAAGQLPAPAAAMSLMAGEILGQLQDQIPPIPDVPVVGGVTSVPDLPGLPTLPPLGRIYELPPLPELGDSTCSNVEGFVTVVIHRVLSVLEATRAVVTIPVLGQIFSGIVGVIKFGLSVIVKAFDVVIAPVLGVLKAIAAGVAIGVALIGALSTWRADVIAAPAETRFGIDLEVVSGEIVVDAGGADRVPWPAVITDCAAVANLQIPARSSSGAAVILDVTHSTDLPLLEVSPAPRTLDEMGRMSVTYVTDNETAEQARGTPLVGVVSVSATVEREDIRRLCRSVVGLLMSQVPGLVADALAPIVQPVIAEFQHKVADLARVSGHALVYVTHHRRPPPPVQPDTCLQGPMRVVNPADAWLLGHGDGEASAIGEWGWTFEPAGRFSMSMDGLVINVVADGSVLAFSGGATGLWVMDDPGVLSINFDTSTIVQSAEWPTGPEVIAPTPAELTDYFGSWTTTCGSPVLLDNTSYPLQLQLETRP